MTINKSRNFGCVFAVGDSAYFWHPGLKLPKVIIQRDDFISGLSGRVNAQTGQVEILDATESVRNVYYNFGQNVSWHLPGKINQISWQDTRQERFVALGDIEKRSNWFTVVMFNDKPLQRLNCPRTYRGSFMPMQVVDDQIFWANDGNVYKGIEEVKTYFGANTDYQSLLLDPRRSNDLLILSYQNQHIHPHGAELTSVMSRKCIGHLNIDEFGIPISAGFIQSDGKWLLAYLGNHFESRSIKLSLIDLEQKKQGKIIAKFPAQHFSDGANSFFTAPLDAFATVPAIAPLI